MPQQLNIKHPEAHALASELAGLTGESLTDAVVVSVRERLERKRAERQRRAEEVEAKVAAIMAFAREIAAHMEPGTTSDTSWLYDEDGFPT